MIYAENIFLCVALPFLISLLFLRGDSRHFSFAFLLGMATCLIAAYISGFFGLVIGFSENDISIFISPIVEELMKLLPLLFFIVMFAPGERKFLMLAVGVGVGFATFENCCYILTYGAGSLSYIIIRGLAVGVMHIISIITMAIWMVIAKRLKVLSFPAVLGGVSLAMIFHALYNLLVSGPLPSRIVGYLLPMLTAGCLYPLYKKLPRLWK